MQITDSAVVTTAELYDASTRPPMVVGGTLQGHGRLVAIWGTAYNKRITAGHTPRFAAKHALHQMLTQGKMGDLARMGYYNAPASDPGAPAGFNFLPGQQFPLPPVGTLENIPFATLGLMIAIVTGSLLGVIIAVVEIIIDLIEGLISLFSGKPRAQDTITVGNRFASGANPASFIAGTLILRNLQQNDIVLSSSDAASQKILGDIRRQAEEMIVAQGQTEQFAKDLITFVYDSANQTKFKLPAYLKNPPPGQGGGGGGNPPPPPPPGECPPWEALPDCFPVPPAPDDSLDEIGDLAQLSAWGSEIITIAILNVYQAILNLTPANGQGGNSDPVTCTQLTAQVALIVEQLTAVATAIGALATGGSQPIDLTQVIAELQAIAAAIATAPGDKPVDLSIIEAELAGDPTLQAFIDELIAKGVIQGPIGQLI